MDSQLAQIAATTDQKQRAEQYKQLLATTLQSAGEANISVFLDHSKWFMSSLMHCYCSHCRSDPGVHRLYAVLSDEVPLVISRQLLTTFAQDMSHLPADVQKAVAQQWVPCSTADYDVTASATLPFPAAMRPLQVQTLHMLLMFCIEPYQSKYHSGR